MSSFESYLEDFEPAIWLTNTPCLILGLTVERSERESKKVRERERERETG